MGSIGSWEFCVRAAQCITSLAGQAVYRAIGRRVIYELQLRCSDDCGLARYASDDDVLEVIDFIKKEMSSNVEEKT